MTQTAGNLRVIPSSWLGPLDLAAVFGRRPDALEVDLGSGKGRFILARAGRYPDTSFLGIDRMLPRVMRVEREARRRNLANIRVMYVEARYAVGYLLPPRSVTTYYLFFSDPWPKRRQRRQRLFDQGFLDAVAKTLIPGGAIHVATDYRDYFEVMRARVGGDARFESLPPFVPLEDERTDFELLFMGRRLPIWRASFRTT